jgi:hypothetical protein
MNIAMMNIDATAWTIWTTCICGRVSSSPGTILSSAKPEAMTNTPRKSSPPQKTIFSPALKRPDGGCSPPSMPPARISQRTSSREGRLPGR